MTRFHRNAVNDRLTINSLTTRVISRRLAEPEKRSCFPEASMMAVPSGRAAEFVPEPMAHGSQGCPRPTSSVEARTAGSGSGPLGFASQSATAFHYPPILRAFGARSGNGGAGERQRAALSESGERPAFKDCASRRDRQDEVIALVRPPHRTSALPGVGGQVSGNGLSLVRPPHRTSALNGVGGSVSVGAPSRKGRKFQEVGYGTLSNVVRSAFVDSQQEPPPETLHRGVTGPVKSFGDVLPISPQRRDVVGVVNGVKVGVVEENPGPASIRVASVDVEAPRPALGVRHCNREGVGVSNAIVWNNLALLGLDFEGGIAHERCRHLRRAVGPQGRIT